eukprot:1435465-Amphidinium_carterae.1
MSTSTTDAAPRVSLSYCRSNSPGRTLFVTGPSSVSPGQIDPKFVCPNAVCPSSVRPISPSWGISGMSINDPDEGASDNVCNSSDGDPMALTCSAAGPFKVSSCAP